MEEDADQVLLDRYRDGATEALEQLVERYRRPLFGFILSMSEGREDADEVFQEVWFRVIRKVGTYRHRNFFGWLVRIAHNLIIDRSRRRRPTLSLDAEREDGTSPAEAIPSSEPGPDCIAVAGDVNEAVRQAIATLPPEQREVVVLRLYTGLAFKEIARLQKASINTVLARMQYGLRKLRLLLQEQYESVMAP